MEPQQFQQVAEETASAIRSLREAAEGLAAKLTAIEADFQPDSAMVLRLGTLAYGGIKLMDTTQAPPPSRAQSRAAANTSRSIRQAIGYSPDMGAGHCSREQIGKVFRRAARAAGLKDFHFHDPRHHGATMALNKGFTAPIVMALGGWKTERMMWRYAAVTDQTLRAAAEAVSGNAIQPLPLAIPAS